MVQQTHHKLYAENKKAFFDYEILEKFEAGLELKGHEVKAIRSGRIQIAGTFVRIVGGQAWLLGSNIPPYQAQNTPPDYDPTRTRKLLLHKKELNELIGKSQLKGLTLVPLRIYDKHDLIKLEFAVCRGKKKTDKRETIKRREADREIKRTLK